MAKALLCALLLCAVLAWTSTSAEGKVVTYNWKRGIAPKRFIRLQRNTRVRFVWRNTGPHDVTALQNANKYINCFFGGSKVLTKQGLAAGAFTTAPLRPGYWFFTSAAPDDCKSGQKLMFAVP